MADFEDRPGSGALFTRRKTKPNQPDYGGEVVLDPETFSALCERYKAGQSLKLAVAGWAKTASSGTKFISLKPSPYQERQVAPDPSPRPSPLGFGVQDDDDSPF